MINASKEPIGTIPGTAIVHHADSFAMIRGGHVDLCVLGAFEVAQNGDLANWATSSNDLAPAVGGAMDLAIGAKETWVMMTLFARDGTCKLVSELTYPATGVNCVTRVYTPDAVFVLGDGVVRVRETYGVGMQELSERMGMQLEPVS